MNGTINLRFSEYIDFHFKFTYFLIQVLLSRNSLSLLQFNANILSNLLENKLNHFNLYALGTISSILCVFFVLIGISGGFCIKIATNIVGIVIVDRYRYTYVLCIIHGRIASISTENLFSVKIFVRLRFIWVNMMVITFDKLKTWNLIIYPGFRYASDCANENGNHHRNFNKKVEERMRHGLKDLYCSTLNSEIGKSKLKQWIDTTGYTLPSYLGGCYILYLENFQSILSIKEYISKDCVTLSNGSSFVGNNYSLICKLIQCNELFLNWHEI